ncbi:unnamed protein product, partial [Iphiclides podalirius]
MKLVKIKTVECWTFNATVLSYPAPHGSVKRLTQPFWKSHWKFQFKKAVERQPPTRNKRPTDLRVRGAELGRGLPERAVHWARGRVLGVCHVVGVRVRVRVVRVRERVRVRVRRVAVGEPRGRRLGGVPCAQVRRAAMVLGERERRARRPPVAAPLLHVSSVGASRGAAARAPPSARQRMPPRLSRAPLVALAARHPSRSPRPRPLASPPTAHRLIRAVEDRPLLSALSNRCTLGFYARRLREAMGVFLFVVSRLFTVRTAIA